jgi:hypothetical protein
MRIGKALAIGLAGAGVACSGAIASELAAQSFALPRDVVSAAAAFQGYMSRAAAIDTGFKNEAAVSNGLHTGAAYEPRQFEEGMIAYGAVAALRDDAFVTGVTQAGGARGSDALAAQLIANPASVTQLAGADEAARMVAAALEAKSAALEAAGVQAKSASYSIQHHAWSKVMVPDPQQRLAEVKSLSAAPAQPGDDETGAMVAAVAGSSSPAATAPAAYTDVQVRSLALAAEAVLGHASASERDKLSPLLSESRGAECLHMAKLNLYQCMAVAGPHYEDVFCLAQHAMADTAECVADAAHGRAAPGTASPTFVTAQAAPRPAPQAAPQAASQPGTLQLASGRTLRVDGR